MWNRPQRTFHSQLNELYFGQQGARKDLSRIGTSSEWCFRKINLLWWGRGGIKIDPASSSTICPHKARTRLNSNGMCLVCYVVSKGTVLGTTLGSTDASNHLFRASESPGSTSGAQSFSRHFGVHSELRKKPHMPHKGATVVCLGLRPYAGIFHWEKVGLKPAF